MTVCEERLNSTSYLGMDDIDLPTRYYWVNRRISKFFSTVIQGATGTFTACYAFYLDQLSRIPLAVRVHMLMIECRAQFIGVSCPFLPAYMRGHPRKIKFGP